MDNPLWNEILSNLTASLIVTAIALFMAITVRRLPAFNKLLTRWVKFVTAEPEDASQMTFSQRLEKLTRNLVSSSEEFDKILDEMHQVSQDRESVLKALETNLNEFSQREVEMKKKIDELEKVSIPALEYFLQATERSEKRSARRDLWYFIGGVVVSTVAAIILQIAF